MKKFLSYILTLCYLLLSIGVVQASVLCSQQKAKLTSAMWVTVSDDSGVCSKCAKCATNCNQRTKGCCKDKTEVLKVELDQSVSESFTKLSVQQFIVLRTLIPTFLFEQLAQSSTDDYIDSNNTPLGKPVPINILNCVYRI